MWIETRQNRGGTWSLIAKLKVAGMKTPRRAFLISAEPYSTAVKAKAAARKLGILAQAERWGEDTERMLRDQKQRTGNADIARYTVAQLIDEHLKDAKTLALKALRDRQRHLLWWRAEIGTLRCFDQVTASVIRAARERLKHAGRANGTANRYMRAMSKCWSFGRAAGLIRNEQVWFRETTLPEPAGRTRFLSDAELAALLKAAEKHPHVRAAVVVAVSTGLRMSELLRLTWTDVSLQEGATHIAVRISKTGRQRQVYLPPMAVEALKGLRVGRVVSMTNGPVFLNELTGRAMNNHHLNNRWRRHILPAARKAAPGLLADFRWHDLRHSAASYLAQAGAGLLGIATVLGHSNLQTTKRYAHLVEGEALPAHAGLDARLQQAIEQDKQA